MAIKPVAIPVSASEVKLIQRRQATLVMQMNKIDEAVRSRKYSKAEEKIVRCSSRVRLLT